MSIERVLVIILLVALVIFVVAALTGGITFG